MKYLLTLLLLLVACASPAENTSEVNTTTPEPAEANTEQDASASMDSDAVPSQTIGAALRDSVFSEVPELIECREMLMSQEGMLIHETSRTKAGYVNMIEIPCGPPPGTGAYGYTMALVAEWEAVENSSNGPMPREYSPIEFHERNSEGAFVSVGYVTQAIGLWNEEDLSGGYLHLLYKYAGAGQCGMLVSYSSEAWRSPFMMFEARERTCDAEPCEDDSCYEPRNWEVVYSLWE